VTDWQLAAFGDSRRFVVAVAKRRLGKITLGALRLWLAAETRPGNYFCVAPSKHSLLACWDRFLAVTPSDLLQSPLPRLYEQGLPCVPFANGSRVYFITEEAVLGGGCRGWQIDGIVIDEFFLCRRKADLAMVLLPALSDKGGWVLAVGTPFFRARPAMDRLRLLLRIAAMRAGFDLSSVGIHIGR
jgi:hypothetical protein